MRTILRTLPIRWQITVLHTTILAVVLAAGGLGLWNAQRTFEYDTLIARQVTEVRALIPQELDLKLEAGMYSTQKPDLATLKERYAKISAAILPPGEDPSVTRKKVALLDPKLVDQLFPPGGALPRRDELEAVVSKLVVALFSPDQNPTEMRKKLLSLDPDLVTDLFPTPTAGQVAFQKYLADLVQQLSAKDRGVIVLALDGFVLAQSGFGPACPPSVHVSKGGLEGDSGNALFKQLRVTGYHGQVDQGQRLTLLLPVIWQQDRPLALAQICVPISSIDAGLDQLAASLAIGWVLVVGVATLLGVTATRRVLRPLDQVVATAGRIAAGDLQQRVGLPPGRTEIAQLGAAFDAMIARLEQAFAVQRRFVADAAHELRTPLTALSTSVELLLIGAADNDPATGQRLLRHLDSELSRVIRLTNDLLTLSRLDARPRSELRPTDLGALIEEVAEHSRAQLRGQKLVVDLAPELWVLGDPDRLRQVVLNLLDNARKYTPPGGQIALRAGSELVLNSELLTQNSVVIEVQDTGVGIPADAQAHLFERFYRVDSARARASGGSGLGLAIVQAIVQAHGGQVSLRSRPDEGTCVTIELPRLASLARPVGAQDLVAAALPGATMVS